MMARGHHGVITELLDQRLGQLSEELGNLVFYNCGPAAMVRPLKQLSDGSAADRFNAIDYWTSVAESAAPVMPRWPPTLCCADLS